MNVALYATIWLSMLFFVLGEAGKRSAVPGGPPRPWAWPVWALGASLCAVHMVVAMGGRHGWSQQSAIAATARQTEALYGINWGGGVYVNYAFLALWTAELIWWRASPVRDYSRPTAVTWIVRAFYLVILFNAAVVFAAGGRSLAGLLLIALLLWIWRPRRPAMLL